MQRLGFTESRIGYWTANGYAIDIQLAVRLPARNLSPHDFMEFLESENRKYVY